MVSYSELRELLEHRMVIAGEKENASAFSKIKFTGRDLLAAY
jgi:hypothetical protein